METEKTVSVGGKTLTIRKIPLGKYPAIFAALKDLSGQKDLIPGFSSKDVMNSLPSLLAVALPTAIKVAHEITDIPEDEISTTWGLDDFVAVTEAVFAVNNFEYVYASLKKAGARLGQTPQVTAESTT